MEAINFLAAPFALCVVLLGIHCYLGLHVLARGVIFIDLALAQVAACGSVFAYLLGYDHHDMMTYFISLGTTLFAALFLSYANAFRHKLSQEAIIGIVYAMASATVILFIDKVSHGAEHLKQSLVGHLLWVSWEDVLKVTVVYSIVAAIHFFWRHKFVSGSIKGGGHWLMDFAFYGLFGVVITSSVQYAGVLLVFAFLIVPAVVSSLFFKSWRTRLFFGWVFGIILSILGMTLSYNLDLPAGAIIVVTFSLVPVMLLFSPFAKKIRS